MAKSKLLNLYINKNRKYLKNCLRNVFEWCGVPESIYIKRLDNALLFEAGYIVGFEYEKAPVVAEGAIHGLDLYYRPTQYTSSNPYIKTVNRTIGKDCVVCYNTTNYIQPETCNDIVESYAVRLAELELSSDVSCKNSRATLIPNVSDDKEAIRTEKILQKIYDGEPAALSFKSAFNNKGVDIFPIKARDNMILAELADARRNIMADFWSELGVDTIAVDKKERTNLMEMSSNKTQLKISGDIMLKPRMEFCEAMNKMFNLNMTVKLNQAVIENSLGGAEDESQRTAELD